MSQSTVGWYGADFVTIHCRELHRGMAPWMVHRGRFHMVPQAAQPKTSDSPRTSASVPAQDVAGAMPSGYGEPGSVLFLWVGNPEFWLVLKGNQEESRPPPF